MGFSQIGIASVYSIAFNGFLEPGPKAMTMAIAAASVSALVVAALVGGRGIVRSEPV